MGTLYQLGAEYERQLRVMLDGAEEETGEINSEAFAGLQGTELEVKEKVEKYGYIYRMLGNEIERYRAEEKRIAELRKRMERTQTSLEKNLDFVCKRFGIIKIDGIMARVNYKSSEETVVDNLDELPEEFIRKKIETAADKNAIKAAIKAGRKVPGAHLEKHENIQIK